MKARRVLPAPLPRPQPVQHKDNAARRPPRRTKLRMVSRLLVARTRRASFSDVVALRIGTTNRVVTRFAPRRTRSAAQGQRRLFLDCTPQAHGLGVLEGI